MVFWSMLLLRLLAASLVLWMLRSPVLRMMGIGMATRSSGFLVMVILPRRLLSSVRCLIGSG
jgi:hypothetical protein